MRAVAAEIGERRQEAGAARHLGQKLGDPDARQDVVDHAVQALGLRRRDRRQRRDVEPAIPQLDAAQLTAL